MYAVTVDNGTKVAECKAQETCKLGLCPSPVPGGQGKAEAGIVIRDDAPVYKSAKSTSVTWKLKRGDSVAAIEPKGKAWQFYEESGRVRIAFLDEDDNLIGWMRLDDLAKFTYDFCAFEPSAGHPPPGYPFIWNVCFRQARDAKLKELRGYESKQEHVN